MGRKTRVDVVNIYKLRQKGLTYRQIAKELGISIFAVHYHLREVTLKKVVKYVNE